MLRRNLLLAGAASLVASGAHAAASPVVLELFTSQGCSSCPPADALLGVLAQRPGIIALAWHVDYWNRLGWRDQFASKEATARQESYARQLGSEVFTPALVINGTSVVVGSDRSAVERAILATAPFPVPVTLNRTAEGFIVEVSAGRGPLRALSILYDTQHETDVGAGENQGERLREYRIVRHADVLAEWPGGTRQFTVSPMGSGQGRVILVQSADLRVVGAALSAPG
jgi:hypothetical protein